MMRTLLSVLVLVVAASAQLSVPAIFAEHMVLQRDEPVVVWGKAAAGADVTVSLGDDVTRVAAGPDGRWRAALGKRAASAKPVVLRIASGDSRIEIADVLVGEVWLCSGQSNMSWRVSRTDGFAAAGAASDARLRMFTGLLKSEPVPQDDAPGTWSVASAETVGAMSGVAFWFGRRLLDELDCPVGLVNQSWGGSSIEAWMSRGTLEGLKAGARALERQDHHDRELASSPREYAAPDVDDADWRSGRLPATFRDLGADIDGVIWFRKRVEIPKRWEGKTLVLSLGAIDDHDVTFVDGREVGGTRRHDVERVYEMKEARSGGVVIAVRVVDTGGVGGFTSSPEKLVLHSSDAPDDRVSLAGEWKYHIAADTAPPAPNRRPAHLYNGMIHAVRDYPLRGAIWYQGESNAHAPREYLELFPAMIHDWRRLLRPKLPFYFVQLANFGTDLDWATLRESQFETLRTVADTGMAVITDIGDADDIHPRNKRDVGHRLARWALADTYGLKGIVRHGPLYETASFHDDGVTCRFELDGSSFAETEAEKLRGFELAGADAVWRRAEARIEGDTVIVSSPTVAAPQHVRYAWASDPDGNLANVEGLPASPFRASRE